MAASPQKEEKGKKGAKLIKRGSSRQKAKCRTHLNAGTTKAQQSLLKK